MNILEKEFVPYDEALALKELGFDEPCFGKWLSSFQSGWKDYELILEMGMNEEFEDNRNVYLLDGACSAPTFSQAFRWFREKYNYYISVFRTHDGSWGVDLWLLGVHKPKATIFSETYEEAELACLNKLIEIVKEKHNIEK